MRSSVRDYWLEFNRPLEGRVNYMYLDSKGYVTTGLGNKIDATAAPLAAPTEAERDASHTIARQLAWSAVDDRTATDDEVDAEWDVVKSKMELADRGGGAFGPPLTSLHLSEQEIDRMVFDKLDEMEAYLQARAEFGDFANWPADAQLGVLSMAWAMGPAFRFPRFQSFVASGDWNAAATECRFRPNVGTIVMRNDRDQQLFRNAAQVVAGNLDPDVLVFPACDPG